MSNALATSEQIQMMPWQQMKEQASMLVTTGFLPASVKTPEQAIAIMLTGQELGIPPMQALRGVNVIQGTPTIKPELMLALCVKRIPGFKYSFGKCDSNSAAFTVTRPELAEPYTSTFTMEDAKKAGLTGNPTWGKYPANMLRWRAVGNALHIACPDVLVGVYTPEEMGAEVDADGSVIDAPAIPASQPPPEAEEAVIVNRASDERQTKVHELWVAVGDKKTANELCAEALGRAFKPKDLTEDEAAKLIDVLTAVITAREHAATEQQAEQETEQAGLIDPNDAFAEE